MSKQITWDYFSLVYGGEKKKPKRISRKKRIEELEQSVRDLNIKCDELATDLSRQTAVYTPHTFFSMNLFSEQASTNKTVYAAEAIKLIANHLGIRFNDIAPKNIVEPIPPPVEHDDEDYDDE